MIFLRKEAQVDLDEIFIWYEEQLEGLGFRFIKEIEEAFEKISRNPCHASVVQGDARGVSLRKFPYEIIFRIDDNLTSVRIIAVLHQHRDPAWFRKRIE